MRPAAGRGAGFALVSALFVIVVLGLLAAVAVRIGTAQQQTVSSALGEARALAAAEAGIDWGAYNALSNGSCSGTTLNLSEGALNGYTVTVTCTATAFTENNSPYQSYTIAATASFGTYGSPDFVQRVVRATFTSAT
jgi:MSHA biogenesis protein MshP